MKWITSTDIKQWADTRDAQELLPELIVRLIRASSTHINKLRFPCGDAVHLTGWDGVLESSESVCNIPSGVSLWECGVDSNSKNKANSDYSKRTRDSLGYDKKNSTFVFVTPRIWNGAVNWANEMKKDGEWKDVIVITAVELEDWLMQCPAVALWLLSKIIGKSIDKVYSLENYWNKWATGKDVKLVPELLLGGREKEQQELYDSISKPSISIIQSISESESLAFAVACILQSPNKLDLLSRAIVVEDENILETLISKYSNLILIINVDSKDHVYATQNGHSIIYALNAGESLNQSTKLIQLPLLDREKFIKSLIDSGVNKNKAEKLSRETVRNITILRRSLELDYTTPEWAKPENIRDIIPAILVARWNDNMEGDKEILSLIAGESYDSYISKIYKWKHKDDSPFIEINGRWRLYSPYEAFNYAASYITAKDFANYNEALTRITADNDPDALNKMNATSIYFWKYKQKYSYWMKEGLFQTSIMISLAGGRKDLHTPMDSSLWIDSIISSILNASTIEWWLSNKPIIGFIAEASPKSYIDFIQIDLKKNDSIIKRLFTPRGNSNLWGCTENYTEILFSLQSMLWDETLLLQICIILSELCSIDNNTNLYNKPINALYETFVIWCPQTYANTSQRLTVLELIGTKYPKLAFDLYFKLLDGLDSATVISIHPMKWRCYNYSKSDLTYNEIWNSRDTIVNYIISVCDCSEKQICNILKLASQKELKLKNRKKLFDHVVLNKSSFKGNHAITDIIRDTVYRHRTYADEEWALPKDEVDKWENLLLDLEPENLLERYRWIFHEDYVNIPEIDIRDLTGVEADKKIMLYKYNAIEDIEKSYGFKGVIQFVKNVGAPYMVGESYAYSGKEESYYNVLNILLEESSESIIYFAKGFFQSYTSKLGLNKVISILKSIDINKYKDIIKIPLTVMSCARNEMWAFIETLPDTIKNEYWENIQIGFFSKDDSLFIIRKMIEYKRFDMALNLVYNSIREECILPTSIIEEIVIGFLTSKKDDAIVHQKYQIAKVIYKLDKMDDVNIQTLFAIELGAYRILEMYGNINETKFVKEIMSNPESMMDIIDTVYLSSEEKDQLKEIEYMNNHESYATQCFHILSTLCATPFVDSNNMIDEKALNNYIERLLELGNAKNKIDGVNDAIGGLLGNYPEIDNYPPTPLCDIIEKYNNRKMINAFKIRIYNKRGVTVRSAFEGGTLEEIEASKYKRYADKVRFTHPIVCRIFDDLCNEYKQMAKDEDDRVEIEKMEF